MKTVNCVIRPGVFADGESVSVRCTVYNDNADKSEITDYSSCLYVRFANVHTPITRTQRTVFSTPIAYGESRDVVFVHTINLSLKEGVSSNTSTATYFAGNRDVRYLQVFLNSNYAMRAGILLNARLAPAVPLFELKRAADGIANDEGENLLANVQLALAKNRDLPVYLCCTQGPEKPVLLKTDTYPVHPMYSDTWAECEASASSVYSGNDYSDSSAYRAFNGLSTDAWRSSAKATGPWIQLKLPRPLYDIRVTLVNSHETPAHGMTDGMVYGVDVDGESLTQIGVFSGRDGETASFESVIICDNTEKAYNAVRIKASAWNGGSFAAVSRISITGNRTPAAKVPAGMQILDLSDQLDALLDGVEDAADLVPMSFSNSADWNFLLAFGDEYEQSLAEYSIARAFANLHLSGMQSGGACFGGFSTSRPGMPKLESHYPAHLYGGIAKIGSGWTQLVPLSGSTPAEYGGGVLRCRKIEDKCIIAGSLLVKPKSSGIALAELPEGFVPAYNVFSLNPCSGGRIARIGAYCNAESVDEAMRGKLVLTWVKNIGDGDNYTDAAIWIQCSIEYWVEAVEPEAVICGTAICGEAICGGE